MDAVALPNAAYDTSRAQTRTPALSWIVSPTYDAWFFLASVLVVFLPLIASEVYHINTLLILVAVGVTANGPHLTSTWTRVYMDPQELRERPFSYVVIPLLILSFVIWLSLHNRQAFRVINSIILVWATWHFSSQCYGLLRIYQRKSGEKSAALAFRLETWFVHLTALSGLLWRLHYGPTVLFGATLLLPRPPLPIVYTCFAALGVTVTAMAVSFTHRLRTQQIATLPWKRLAFLSTVVIGFWVPFFLIKDGTAAFAAAAWWHGLQYLGIMYHFNRRKFENENASGARLVAWVSQEGRGLAYLALLLGMAGAVYGVIYGVVYLTGKPADLVGLMIWSSLTLSHYWVDGLIWKMRRPRVAQTLQVAI